MFKRKVVSRNVLKKRPDIIRYSYLAVTDEFTYHTGTAYGALFALQKSKNITDLRICDYKTGRIVNCETDGEGNINLDAFLRRWRSRYLDPNWNYEKEVERGVQPPADVTP